MNKRTTARRDTLLDPRFDKKISIPDEIPSFITIIVHSISIMMFTDHQRELDPLNFPSCPINLTVQSIRFWWFSMASSKYSCFNKFTSDPLMNGWKIFTGEHTQLCYYFHSIYKSGVFCETFHSDEDGWKECEARNKLIHCGCFVSLTKYSLLNFSGITSKICKDANLGIGSHTDLIPLFEILASASDANLWISHLIIPKDYAKAHFPVVVSDNQKITVDIIDTDRKEWDDICFCCSWPCGYSKTYVLSGPRDFIISKKDAKRRHR